jgi:predicted transcriptional regulator
MTVQTVREIIDEPTSPQMLFSDPRLAVQEDRIVCLICGARFRQLTNSHLRGHGTSVAEYRARFGYNRRRALMCRALRRLYMERAARVGLADRILRRPIVETPELRRLIPVLSNPSIPTHSVRARIT